MTTRSQRRIKGLLAPRRPRTVTTYAVHPLDNSREEIMPRSHRDAAPDDPWLSPSKSEAIRALLVLIEFTQAHTYYEGHTPDEELDLRGFCEDAKLTDKQTEVVLMVGEGWGIGAIATRLGISRQAVSTHLSRGRGRLVRLAPPLDERLRKVYISGGEVSLEAV